MVLGGEVLNSKGDKRAPFECALCSSTSQHGLTILVLVIARFNSLSTEAEEGWGHMAWKGRVRQFGSTNQPPKALKLAEKVHV